MTPLLSQTPPLNRNTNSTPKVTFNTSVSTQKEQVTNTTSKNMVRSPTALLSRNALPQTVKWVGNQEGSFEDFLGLITAHIGQQPHLVYIIISEFITL